MIIVFARAPVAGRVKTRLIPRLGAPGAARLHLRLVRHALATAARCGPVELHLSESHSLFRHAKRQRGTDLGARMHHALSAALRKHDQVILIGSDCPALTPADLRRAGRLLRGGCDVVLAPAEDGGYALIGVRKVSPAIFSDMAWGDAQVYAQAVQRLEKLGYRWRPLRTLWDVDRPEDLDRLRSLRISSGTRPAARR
jgi:hypothetical protein